MKERLFNFIDYIAFRMPLKYSVPLSIISLIVLLISMFSFSLNLITMLILFSSLGFTTLFCSNIWITLENKAFNKKNIQSIERLKEKLTNEFQTVSLQTYDDDFVRRAVGKSPFVFKARIENDIVYYQFETKDGEIIDSGDTNNFVWFEGKIIL